MVSSLSLWWWIVIVVVVVVDHRPYGRSTLSRSAVDHRCRWWIVTIVVVDDLVVVDPERGKLSPVSLLI